MLQRPIFKFGHVTTLFDYAMPCINRGRNITQCAIVDWIWVDEDLNELVGMEGCDQVGGGGGKLEGEGKKRKGRPVPIVHSAMNMGSEFWVNELNRVNGTGDMEREHWSA